MPVQLWPLSTLRSFKKADKAAVSLTARRIRKLGFDTPILATERGVIVAEDCAYHAALKLGLSEVPVQVVTDWTPAKAHAYALQKQQGPEVPFDLADNVRQNAEWYAERYRARYVPPPVAGAEPFEELRHATAEGQRQWLQRHSEAEWFEVPWIYWHPELEDQLIEAYDRIVLQARLRPDVPRIRRLCDVVAFLHRLLSGGDRVAAGEVFAAALEAGIGRRTLNRAKAQLRVRTERVGFGRGGHFVWSLASQAA